MMLHRRWRVVGAGSIALFVATSAFATPAFATTTTGVLDTSFNGNGKVAISHPWTIGRMTPAPNNGVYVALDAQPNINQHGPYPVHLTRLLSNGTPDPTFGARGHADVDLGGGGTDAVFEIVHDGTSVLLLLNNYGNDAFGVVRVKTDGRLDPTFGSGGRVVFTYPVDSHDATESIVAEHVLPDGRIEVVLQRDQLFLPHAGAFLLMRLHADGSPDTSLAPYGVKTLVSWSSAGDGPNSTPQAAFTGNGKVYAAVPYGSGARTTVRRFATNGAPDTSFNGNGARPYGCPDWQSTIDGPRLLVDSLGRPLLFCTINEVYDVFVARLTTTGAADNSFGSHGTFRAWVHAYDANHVKYGLDPANRVVFQYTKFTTDSGTVVYVSRYTSAGVADTAFGTSGTASLAFGPLYDLNASPAFGAGRMYLSIYPNEAPCEVLLAVTA